MVNQTYTYDSLSNLLTRNDTSTGVGTAGVGTIESFQYDNLNRLTMSSFYGGAITPAKQVQVMYDARGNITYKSDVGRYWYDSARPNRLTNITLETAPGATIAFTGTRALSYAFDDYLATARIGANNVTTGNGNLMYTVSHDTAQNRHTARWESYTSFNMINDIKFGALTGTTSTTVVAPGTSAQATTLAGTPVEKSLSFIYGPEHQRIKQVAVGGPNPGTTWYLNGEDSLGLTYEKELKSTGITEHKHYLQAGGITFAMHTMRVKTAGGTIAVPALPTGTAAYSSAYLHHDQLGSVVAITNTAGVVVERLAYDPWGKRRFASGTNTGKADTLDAITGQTIDRGFTMHEHIDEMGIINMNGRIYDPLIGRFMSADPYIQAPDDLQSHNRYAYVMNNPLNLTDPSGYNWLTKTWKKAWKSPIFKAVLGIVVAVVAPYALTWLAPTLFVASSLPLALATGALSGYASTGTLKGALTGAFTAGLMHGVGTIGVELGLESGGLGKIALHAGAGCVSSVAGGGSCKSGAISGALGEAGLNLPDGGTVLNTVKAAMLGGIGSKIAGGKFSDGAQTGAFGYLFNELMHSSSKIQQGNADKHTMWAYENGWIDADGKPKPTDYAAIRKDMAGLTDVLGTAASLGTAACVAFTPCAAGAVTAGAVIGGSLSVANSVFSASPSSTFVDLGVDAVFNKVSRGWKFASQVVSEVVKKNYVIDTLKQNADAAVKR